MSAAASIGRASRAARFLHRAHGLRACSCQKARREEGVKKAKNMCRVPTTKLLLLGRGAQTGWWRATGACRALIMPSVCGPGAAASGRPNVRLLHLRHGLVERLVCGDKGGAGTAHARLTPLDSRCRRQGGPSGTTTSKLT